MSMTPHSRSYDVIDVKGGKVVKAWTRGVQFEDAARQQVENVAKMPFVFPHVAIMPDVHFGRGATVGSVIPTLGAIIPAAVGVDIGCGMMALRLPFEASQLPENLAELRTEIEKRVPHGRTDNGGANDRGAWHDVPTRHETLFNFGLDIEWRDLTSDFPEVKHKGVLTQLGTLGTGNHFVEICVDESQGVWAMLHSGSRGVGNKIGMYFIEKAKEDMRRYFINLPDQDLAYIPEGSTFFKSYLKALDWAQQYARINRELMMGNVLEAVAKVLPQLMGPGTTSIVNYPALVQCHHNYVARENHAGKNVLITRKGAVCAREGVMGIIPGSMGAKSFIVRGKGNKDALDSCSHGAGRSMSRTEAKKRFTVEDHIKATEGVECRKDAEVVDETPAAYKSIDAVMEAQKDLVEIVHTLKQVLCIKG